MDGSPRALEGAANIAPGAYCVETLRRLPLADAVLHLLGYALDEEFLARCYEEHRGHGYQDVLTFPDLVQILSDALLVHHGSARQALLARAAQDALPTCKEAFYGKLRRLPLALSVVFLSDASERLNGLLPAQDNPLPESLHGYQVRIIDGKKTKHVAKKLLATRGQAGQLFGAKLLAAYDPATRLIVAVSAHADGEKNDSPLVPDLLRSVRRHGSEKPVINVPDAQFCDLVQMEQYRQNDEFFVLRYHPKLHFHPEPNVAPREFRDEQGRPLIEEYGWVGSPRDRRRRYVRRITWRRSDHKDLSIVTSLTDRTDGQAGPASESIPASDLIELYLTRWKIETVFQDVTQIFGLRKLIGSTPEATAFQAAFCMVVYNAIMVVKSYVAALQPKPLSVDDVSSQTLFTSLHNQLTAAAELIPIPLLPTLIDRPRTMADARTCLRQKLTGLWDPRWKKTRNLKPRHYGKKAKGSGAHTSVHRVLLKHRQQAKGNTPG